MATMAVLLGGAILSAMTIIGGSYLAKHFSGDDSSAEKKRHDKVLEKYQKDYAKYQENRGKLIDWQEQNRWNNEIASQNFEDTDEALKLYRPHPDENLNLTEPGFFSDYYRPSKNQKDFEMIYVVTFDPGFTQKKLKILMAFRFETKFRIKDHHVTIQTFDSSLFDASLQNRVSDSKTT